MNGLELAELTADPIQVLGSSFYFDSLTRARAKELGVNVYEFYGLGRGGALGDVDTQVVYETFAFFHPSVIDFLWTNAKVKADPVAMATSHLEAAYAFADRTFGEVEGPLLAHFATLARRVVDAQAPGACPLVDGYKRAAEPSDPVHGAYLGTILLRELRGGLHIHAVAEVELDPVAACYLQDPTVFALHGYPEEDAPAVTEELEIKKFHAEELTNAAMAKCFDILSESQRDTVAEVTMKMFAALSHPAAVVR